METMNWPEELAFVASRLKPCQIQSFSEFRADSGEVLRRPRHTPVPGYEAIITLDDRQWDLLRKAGNPRVIDIPGKGRRIVLLIPEHSDNYPGFSLWVESHTISEHTSEREVRLFLMDRGPADP